MGKKHMRIAKAKLDLSGNIMCMSEYCNPPKRC